MGESKTLHTLDISVTVCCIVLYAAKVTFPFWLLPLVTQQNALQLHQTQTLLLTMFLHILKWDMMKQVIIHLVHILLLHG